MKQKFVPDDFNVPEKLETKKFRLRMLSVTDVNLDYEAVMSSRKLLRKTFKGDWPRDDMTLEDNRKDLE